MRETHAGECGEHQGKKRLYQCLLTLGYYWPTMKKDAADFVKKCHTCQVQANLIHTHPTSLQNNGYLKIEKFKLNLVFAKDKIHLKILAVRLLCNFR